MAVVEKRVGSIPYREAIPEPGTAQTDRPPVLLVHGFPETSLMWEELMSRLASAGMRSVAPDLIGFGSNESTEESTWETNVALLEHLHSGLGLGPVTLVVHDWGGLIGLRWACDHPGSVARFVISSTGFFPDGRWHGMAKALRGPEGPEIAAAMEADGFSAMMKGVSPGMSSEAIYDYFRAFGERDGKPAVELYRSGDFEKLVPYEGKLESLGVPALILWGEDDAFAPVGGGYRFAKRLPNAEIVVIPDANHFIWSDVPERCIEEVLRFLGEA